MSSYESTTAELIVAADVVESDDARAQRLAWHLHWSLLVISIAVVTMAALLEVRQQTQVALPLFGVLLPELCYWRQMFGMDCPGCGLTRCFVSLAHLDLASAWRYNPTGILLFAGVAGQIPYRAWRLWRPAAPRAAGLPVLPFAMAGSALLLVAQWLVRLALG